MYASEIIVIVLNGRTYFYFTCSAQVCNERIYTMLLVPAAERKHSHENAIVSEFYIIVFLP